MSDIQPYVSGKENDSEHFLCIHNGDEVEIAQTLCRIIPNDQY